MQKISWIIVPRITESQLERLVIDLGASLPNFQRNLKQKGLDVDRIVERLHEVVSLNKTARWASPDSTPFVSHGS